MINEEGNEKRTWDRIFRKKKKLKRGFQNYELTNLCVKIKFVMNLKIDQLLYKHEK